MNSPDSRQDSLSQLGLLGQFLSQCCPLVGNLVRAPLLGQAQRWGELAQGMPGAVLGTEEPERATRPLKAFPEAPVSFSGDPW